MSGKNDHGTAVRSKRDILTRFPELELTDFGDFVVRREYIEGYDILDFHTHTFMSLRGMLPKPLRRGLDDERASFFDLSCYPGSIRFFDADAVGYRKWPDSLWSMAGLKTAFDLYGLNGIIPLLRKAGRKRLLRDMKLGQISRAVILPIHANNRVESTLSMLADIKGCESLIPFASLHPLESDLENKIGAYMALGVRGFKLNPHVQKIDIDDEKTLSLIRLLTATRLPIISCSGLALPENYLRHFPRSFQKKLHTQNIKRFAELMRKIPGAPFVFAHGGTEQNDELIALMKEFPNTFTDISTQPAANIRRLIDEIGCQRLLFGSDYPFFNPAMTIVAVLRATADRRIRKAIFSENARRLLDS